MLFAKTSQIALLNIHFAFVFVSIFFLNFITSSEVCGRVVIRKIHKQKVIRRLYQGTPGMYDVEL